MRTLFCIVVLVGALAGAVWAEGLGDLHFKDMNGAPADLGKARLMAFWRSDCAPCLQEMKILPGIAKGNNDLSIALISLQDAEHTSARLTPMPGNVQVLVAQNDSKKVLAAFGNDRALALPYSVMLDKKGGICGKHYGILSLEQVKEWRKTC